MLRLMCSEAEARNKDFLSPKNTGFGGSREGLCSQTFPRTGKGFRTILNAEGKKMSLHGMSMGGEKRRPLSAEGWGQGMWHKGGGRSCSS